VLSPKLDFEKSTQTSSASATSPTRARALQTSVYYTDRSHLIVTEPDGSLGNDGRGKTYGAELLADVSAAARGSGGCRIRTRTRSGSITRAIPSGCSRTISRTASTRPCRGSAAAGSSAVASSCTPGCRIRPVKGSVYDSDRNLYIPIYDEVNSARAPIHHQLDLRIDYGWHAGPVQMTVFLDVQERVLEPERGDLLYSYDYSQEAAFKSLPIIPSIGVRGVL